MDAFKKILVLTSSFVLAGAIITAIWIGASILLVKETTSSLSEMAETAISKQKETTAKIKAENEQRAREIAEAKEKEAIRIQKIKEKELARKMAIREVKQKVSLIEREFEDSFKPKKIHCIERNPDYFAVCVKERIDAKKIFMSEKGIPKCEFGVVESLEPCW